MATDYKSKPTEGVINYAVLYNVWGRWLICFYTHLPTALAEQAHIKEVDERKAQTPVYVAWILI